MKRKIDHKFPIKDETEKEKQKERQHEDNKPVLSNGVHKNDDVETNGNGCNKKMIDEDDDNDIDMKQNGNNHVHEEEEDVKKRIFTPKTVDLLKQLLIYDPSKRITAENALSHDFLKVNYRNDGKIKDANI